MNWEKRARDLHNALMIRDGECANLRAELARFRHMTPAEFAAYAAQRDAATAREATARATSERLSIVRDHSD